MAKRFQLKEAERGRGESMDVTIPALVNKGGQAYAAFMLGVSQSAVSQWLKKNGYKQVIRYEKAQEKIS